MTLKRNANRRDLTPPQVVLASLDIASTGNAEGEDQESQLTGGEAHGDFGIYLAEISSGEGVFGKIGMVETPDGFANRMETLKGAGQLFFPIIHAGFVVSPEQDVAPKSLETAIRNCLVNRGLVKVGEIFTAPDSSMRKLLVEMESVMRDLGLVFESKDVTHIAANYRARNLAVQRRLERKRDREMPCPYETWRERQSEAVQVSDGPFGSNQSAALRDQTTVGFIIHDLMMGCAEGIRMDLGNFGAMFVHPAPSLEAGLFEARAEQHLLLPSRTRCNVQASLPDQAELRPFAIRILVRESLTMIEVPGPFMSCSACQENEIRFTPGHLACLGELSASPGQTWRYFGSGTRAPLSPQAFNLARKDPSLLPGLRFWAGMEQALDRGIPIQDYNLPLSRRDYEVKLRRAVLALKSIDHHLAEAVLEWVFNVWLSAA